MEGISNHDIDSILRPACRDYVGVYSANNIPQEIKDKSTFYFVCNLSNRGEVGSHFVTVLCFTDYVMYIDSLGLPCTNASISKFLAQLNKPLFFNTTQVQDFESKYCGYYCILFVLYYSSKNKPCKLQFTKGNLLLNDKRCIKYITKLLE